MCKTIKQKVKFRLSPNRVYQLLAEARFHTILTGQKAEISRVIGGKFSVRSGRVSGVNVDLVPGKRIVQAWRTKDFAAGIFSMAAVTLTPTKGGGTELTLIHRGVPKDLIPQVENDWRKLYWERMRHIDEA